MNAGEIEPTTWTPRRWLLCTLLAATAQLALVFWLSDSRVASTRRSATKAHVRIAQSSESGRRDQPSPEKADPALFALVTPRGFSRSAWLTIPRFEYALTNPPEPLHWLGLPLQELADDFAEYVQTNLLSDDVISGPLAAALVQPAVPAPVVVAATVLRVEGALSDRPLLSDQRLPQESEPILTNSAVRVLVNASGMTLSAALWSSSGVAKADQDALSFAKAVRFERLREETSGIGPTNQSKLVYGALVFQWARVRWGEPAIASAKR